MTMEEICEEYNQFSIQSTFVQNLEEFQTYLMVGMDDINTALHDLRVEVLENNKQKLSAQIRNFFSIFFMEEETDFYDEDNKILRENFSFVQSYQDYFQEAYAAVSEDNWRDILKLMDFSAYYYNRHLDFFDSKRNTLEQSLKGIYYYDPKNEDNRDLFNQFFWNQMSEFSFEDGIEKVKKI